MATKIKAVPKKKAAPKGWSAPKVVLGRTPIVVSKEQLNPRFKNPVQVTVIVERDSIPHLFRGQLLTEGIRGGHEVIVLSKIPCKVEE